MCGIFAIYCPEPVNGNGVDLKTAIKTAKYKFL
jgi:hypothetical protein